MQRILVASQHYDAAPASSATEANNQLDRAYSTAHIDVMRTRRPFMTQCRYRVYTAQSISRPLLSELRLLAATSNVAAATDDDDADSTRLK